MWSKMKYLKILSIKFKYFVQSSKYKITAAIENHIK